MSARREAARATVAEHIETSGLHREAGKAFERAKFLDAAVAVFLELQERLAAPSHKDLCNELRGLVSKVDRAIDDPRPGAQSVARLALTNLSRSARAWLAEVASERPHWQGRVPQLGDWRTDKERQVAFVEIRSLMTRGGQLKKGRGRTKGKQSRPTIEWFVILPTHHYTTVPRKPPKPKTRKAENDRGGGRPPDHARRFFVFDMQVACTVCGYPPPLGTATAFFNLLANLAEDASPPGTTQADMVEIVHSCDAQYRAAPPLKKSDDCH